MERADLLTVALEKYNNGRMKRSLCELFIQQDIATLGELTRRAESLTGDIKEQGRGFRHIAETVIAAQE